MNDYGKISFTIDLSRNQLKGNKYRRSDFVKFSEGLASEVYNSMIFHKATAFDSSLSTYIIEFKFILVWEGEELLIHSVERDRQLHRF